MLWNWFREWHIRRSALRALNRKRLADEQVLAATYPNLIQRARATLRAGDLEQTASLWEEARQKLPNAIVTAEDSLAILLGLKRFDEAEALLRERRRRVLKDRGYIGFYLPGVAQIAEERGEFAKAATQWKAIRRITPEKPWPYLREAACLRALDRLSEADAVLDEASHMAPRDLQVRMQSAQLSDLRRDWQSSLTRWQVLADSFDNISGFLGHARALVELGRIDEAERYLAQAAALHSSDAAIAQAYDALVKRRASEEASTA
jgi:tetratricopeptide (TPR) repeat protein